MHRGRRWILPVMTLLALGAIAASPPANLTKALEEQERQLAERPQDPVVHNDMGNLLTLAGRQAEAESFYRRSLMLDPSQVSVRFNLGLLLQQEGRGREAVELFQDVLELEPRYAWAHYQLGVDSEHRGQRATAIDHYARAFALDPSLSFAEVNPQVIDNRYVTEALLVSQRYSRQPGAAVPRSYGEANRITDLLLERPEAEEGGGGPEAAEEGMAGSGASVEGGAGPAVPPPDEDDDEDSGTASFRGERATGGFVATPPRVITEETIEGSRRPTGRPSTVPSSTTAGRSAGPRSRRPTGTAPTPPPRVVNPGVVQRTPTGRATPPAPPTGTRPGRQRFFPGRTSTGRLELELLPEEPAVRWARLDRAG